MTCVVRTVWCVTLLLSFFIETSNAATTISGELKKWHKITLLFDGVNTDEQNSTNPFTNYRLIVTFTNGATTYTVHGHYAADGNAAETSADNGDKWRVYFTPDQTGTWNYSVSFRTGTNIAISSSPAAGTAVAPLDGEAGSFNIAATDKTGNDFRAQGMLQYVGEHYLQFAETGKYFIKGGADSPENFLGYFEFDQTTDEGGVATPGLVNGLHQYAAHDTHWMAGDPTWQSTKGKGIIGALNYLASQGVNSIYFLTYNIDGGDGDDTWVWTSTSEKFRFDVSKLDQWEIVFSHMDKLGIMMHMVTQETENDHELDGGNLGNERKLYYRELVSRFAHHNAVFWNLGEENDNGNQQRVDFAQYLRDMDPYDHPIGFHNWQVEVYTVHDQILANPAWLQYFEMVSLQAGSNYNDLAITYRTDSENAGKKWVVCGDEQAPEVEPDMSNLATLRKGPLWGNLMGGGGGVEWYFGYQGTFGDVQSEDFTITAQLWEQTKVALDFFQNYLPFQEMEPDNSIFSASAGGLGFKKDGAVYAVYLTQGGNNANVSVNLNGTYDYNVKWYDPVSGGTLQDGSITTVTANNGMVNVGKNPGNNSNDWVLLISKNAIVPPVITVTTWTGAVDSNWFDAGNWTHGVPADTIHAIIPNVTPKAFPVIQGPAGTVAHVKNLTINSNAKITISNLNNMELIIHGNLTNNGQVLGNGRLSFNGPSHSMNQLSFDGILQVKPGSVLNTNGNLVLEDGASLMHGIGTPGGGGTVNGQVTIKRNGHTLPNLWNYWSSPITSANVNIIGSSPYYYNVNQATGMSLPQLQQGWAYASGNMIPGLGYIAKWGGIVSFKGIVNNADTGSPDTVNVVKNPVTTVGYNLIGNPFPSGLSAVEFLKVNGPSGAPYFGNNTLTGSFYFWDDDSSSGSGYHFSDFAVWNGAGVIDGPNSHISPDGNIGAGQGFFVEKISYGTSPVQFSNSMRVSDNNVFFRTAPIQRFWLSVTNPTNDYNETLIAFIDGATDSLDLQYDAIKMRGNNQLALFSKIQGDDLAIQALPLLENDRVVELGLDAGITGNYTLNLKALENLDETVIVLLEDRALGIYQHLRMQPSYTFNVQTTGVINNRFFLHFSAPLSINTVSEGCDENDGAIELNQPGSAIWNYTLADNTGLLIQSGQGLNGVLTIGNLNGGAYNLTLVDNDGYQVIKNIQINSLQTVQADFDYLETGNLYEFSFSSLTIGATSNEWDLGDGTLLTSLQNITHVYASPGNYLVQLTGSNDDCSSYISKEINILPQIFTGIKPTETNHVFIFTNEVKLYLRFDFSVIEKGEVAIYDLVGKRIYNETVVTSGLQEINFQHGNENCFLVKFTTVNGNFSSKILVF